MKQIVKMPEKILNDPNNWTMKGETYYMSHHMYRGTSMEAFETIDSCGNCDGARCDGCEKISIPAGWELAVQCDKLEKALLETGLDKDIVSDLVYNDFGCKTHHLQWENDIPDDVLKVLTTPDEKIFKWMDENYNPDDSIYSNIRFYQVDELKYIKDQMELYAKMRKKEKEENDTKKDQLDNQENN